MANIDMNEYEAGKKARQTALSYVMYVIIGIVLLILEFIFTGWWTILLGSLTITILIVIAANRSAIRGFFGLKP